MFIHEAVVVDLSSSKKIDKIDTQIIKLLQNDSRLSYKKIADKLGISVGTAYNRVGNLEEKKVIKGYTVVTDPAKLGFEITAIISIQAEGKHLTETEHDIAKLSNVISVYDTTGDFDMIVIARFRNRSSLNDFIKNILSMRYLKRTVTNVVLNTIKEDNKVDISES